MWRSYLPVLTIVLPIALGMAVIFLFIEGTIGAATAIAVSFALTAVAVTSVIVTIGADDDSTEGPESRLR
jgi:hypothetical protein